MMQKITSMEYQYYTIVEVAIAKLFIQIKYWMDRKQKEACHCTG